jgi:hypothetical protein
MHIDPTDYDGPIQRDYSKDIQAEINKDGKILRIIQP